SPWGSVGTTALTGLAPGWIYGGPTMAPRGPSDLAGRDRRRRLADKALAIQRLERVAAKVAIRPGVVRRQCQGLWAGLALLGGLVAETIMVEEAQDLDAVGVRDIGITAEDEVVLVVAV